MLRFESWHHWLAMNLGQVSQSLYTCFAFLKIIIAPTWKAVGSLKCDWHAVKCSVSVDDTAY